MVAVAAPPGSTESTESPPSTVSNGGIRRSAPRSLTALLFLLPASALYILFVLWPVAWVAWLSLYRWKGFGPRQFVGLHNFSVLWNDALFRMSFEHSAIWVITASIVPTVLALGIALLLQRARARALLLATLFFPALLPPTVVAAIWSLIYSPISGALNTALQNLDAGRLRQDWLGDPHLALGALFVAWLWSSTGIGILIIWAGLLGASREWTEIALLEGAGAIWRFRHVTLPGLRRPLTAVVLINAALGAEVFDLIFVTTGGGPGYATMVLPLDIYGRAFGGRTGQGAAATCIHIALGLLLAAVAGLLLNRGHERLETGSSARDCRQFWPATPLLLTVTGATLLPLAWTVLVALVPGRNFTIHGPSFNPGAWRLDNLQTVWNAGMAGAMGRSLIVALTVVASTLFLAAPAAFILARHHLGRMWRYAAAGLLLIGLFQSTATVIVPLYALLNDVHLLGTLWGVLLPETARALPFSILALWAFLSGTPNEVIEAAAVDGASSFRQLTSIALPIARPALIAVSLWTFATSWNEYLLPTLVSQDGSLETVPTLLATFIGKYNTQLGLLAAGSLTAILPTVMIYLFLRRPAAAGLSRTEGTIR